MTESGVEDWRPVVGYEALYSVSSQGAVRLEVSRQNKRAGTIVKPSLTLDGYHQVRLGTGELAIRNGRQEAIGKRFMAHRLVAAAFIGPCPAGLVVNHKNGRKLDNRPENLEYVSTIENVHHAIRELGHRRDGEHNPAAKLAPEQVIELRTRAASGVSYPVLSREFGIDAVIVGGIARGRLWKHVGGPRCGPRRAQGPALTDADVVRLRERIAGGEQIKAVARDYRLTPTGAASIAHGVTRLAAGGPLLPSNRRAG
jgi:hypothetical protein